MMYKDMPLSENWEKLITMLSMMLEPGSNAQMIENYMAMLTWCGPDRIVDGKVYLGMYRAPASHSRHHNREGGLVTHLLQMWEAWLGLRDVIRMQADLHPSMNDVFIWRAIVHHDLNKVWKYRLVNSDPWTVEYANDEDLLTTLLGDTHKSLQILNKYNIRLPIPLHAALVTAQGGYSESHPRAETVLGKTVYLLDELSANVIDRLQTNRFWDSKAGGLNEVP